tara:strand:- start:538 stop:1179 length:642 start_codon:yes stop_codon:yes gene_type:complete
MAKNPYFNNFDHEGQQNLVEECTLEAINMHGMDMWYVPRKFVNEDFLFGEDVLSAFTKAFPVTMYLSNTEGFEGEGDIIAKFGLEIRDSIELTIGRKHFESLVTAYDNDITRPREGDLIYFPLSKSLFEIVFTEHERPFYSLGRNYVYQVRAELFQYNQEDLDTGIAAIDDTETDLENADDVSKDVFAQNTEIENEADTEILDFSQQNPFGTF